MPLFRVLESLYVYSPGGPGERIPAGTISGLKNIKKSSIRELLAKGRISEVRPPPLQLLRGFEEREGNVIGMLEDPDTSDEEREKLMRSIDPPEGPGGDYFFGAHKPNTDARGRIVPEPVIELDEDGEYIPGGLSLEEVEEELRGLDPSLGADDDADLVE